MDYLAFVQLPEIKVTSKKEGTLRLWFHIYSWISQHGYADVGDTPDFVTHVQSFRKLEAATNSKHLLEMSRAKVIVRHVLRRKLDKETRDDLNSSPHGMLFGGGINTLPTTVVRFTLPRQKPSTEFKAGVSLIESNYAADHAISKRLSASVNGKLMTPNSLDLNALVGESDRNLLVAGLQALHRDRVSAWKEATSVASIRGEIPPSVELFGLDEVSQILRRVGAGPSSI